jgi:hypothetical protein
MPGVSGVTVVTMLVWFYFFPREAAAASSARHSLRPHLFGRTHHARLGRKRAAGTRSCGLFSPRPACGERSKPQASGEGDYRRVRMRGDSPSPRPSPRKRGEGEVERGEIAEMWGELSATSLRGATATKQSTLPVTRWIASLALAMTAGRVSALFEFEVECGCSLLSLPFMTVGTDKKRARASAGHDHAASRSRPGCGLVFYPTG